MPPARLLALAVSLDGAWNDGTDSDGDQIGEEADNVSAEKVIG